MLKRPCEHLNTFVTESRKFGGTAGVRRRRKCQDCNVAFTTLELSVEAGSANCPEVSSMVADYIKLSHEDRGFVRRILSNLLDTVPVLTDQVH